MTDLYKALIKRRDYLLHLLKLLNAKQTSPCSLEGTLRVSSIRGNPCYYYCHKDLASNKDVHTYIKKSELSKFQPLAQLDYEKKLRKVIGCELSLIEKFLSGYDTVRPEDIYQNLHPARKALITPIIPDWSGFSAAWQKSKPQTETFWDPDTGLITEQGEAARSKSEKIIADKYYSLHIPYLYEKPLVLKDGRKKITLHPDFTILKKGHFKEYYHEHFGLMDHPDYCKKALRKIALYRKNSIFEGDRLLITFETSEQPLNIPELQTAIEHFLSE